MSILYSEQTNSSRCCFEEIEITGVSPDSETEDFITIIAPSMAEVMASFAAEGLAARNYAIVHRGGQHSFRLAGGETLFEGAQMVAATFARRT